MISVVIPSYNSGKYLIKAVDSALIQDADKEIIIIDDCSSDESIYYFVKNYKKDFEPESELVRIGEYPHTVLYWKGLIGDTPVTVLKNTVNLGVAKTRNTGVEIATGEYIAFLDSDDWWVEGKLGRQERWMKKTGAVLCNTAREIMDADGTPVGNIIHTPKTITLKHLMKTNYINCSSVMVKREVMLKYPMEHPDAHEDYLTWLRILRDYEKAVGIDEPLLKYRLSKGGRSRNKLRAAKMTYKTYRYAGFGTLKASFMMIAYTYNGLKKYKIKL